jgi:hypothetical protein
MALDVARAAKCGIGRQVTARKLINHKGHKETQRDLAKSKISVAIRLAFRLWLFNRDFFQANQCRWAKSA